MLDFGSISLASLFFAHTSQRLPYMAPCRCWTLVRFPWPHCSSHILHRGCRTWRPVDVGLWFDFLGLTVLRTYFTEAAVHGALSMLDFGSISLASLFFAHTSQR